MNKYYFTFLSCLLPTMFIISITLSSCNKYLSDLDQVTKNTMTCSVFENKADLYYEKYGKDNSKITVDGNKVTESSQATVKKAFEVLSNVPQEYLEYVFVKYNIPVNLKSYEHSGITGLTQININPLYPMKIVFSTLGSLHHEFGHASHGYAVAQNSSLQDDLTNVANAIVTEYASIARGYLTRQTDASSGGTRNRRQQNSETFAEIFDSWYCSQAARTYIEKNMPKVYEFAQKYLITPTDGTSTSANTTKDINLYLENNNSNFKVYFSVNKKDTSNISYCINDCSKKLTPSSFKNNSNNSNIFESETFTVKDSSFNIEIYSEDTLLRKVLVSR